jgi:ABC-2 type transport system ATP-binding protein
MARSEILALFRELAREGLHVVISSHILHEVDMVSDRVVLINNGYVVAEGDIRSVRGEMRRHPMQIVIRCDRPAALAARALEHDHVVEVQIHDDRQGLVVRTKDADAFYLLLNRIVLDNGLCLETVAPADEDVQSVYAYLIGGQGETT